VRYKGDTDWPDGTPVIVDLLIGLDEDGDAIEVYD
jgi:hypothetical protein